MGISYTEIPPQKTQNKIISMKKTLLIALLMMSITACNKSPYGKGGDNACQFVKEQVPGLRNDIANVEVIAEDSLLSDIGLTFASVRAAKIKNAYYKGKISYNEMDRVLDSCKAELMAVEQSWKYGTVSKRIPKYKNQWRKVYTVKVTMKSGIIKTPRVLMEQDGLKPKKLKVTS